MKHNAKFNYRLLFAFLWQTVNANMLYAFTDAYDTSQESTWKEGRESLIEDLDTHARNLAEEMQRLNNLREQLQNLQSQKDADSLLREYNVTVMPIQEDEDKGEDTDDDDWDKEFDDDVLNIHDEVVLDFADEY